MAKPTGAICNLDCVYCYYLKKEDLYPETESFRMERDVLEDYIAQHIEASPGSGRRLRLARRRAHHSGPRLLPGYRRAATQALPPGTQGA